MEVVTVWKRKRPQIGGRWSGCHVGTDRFGDWLFTPAGSTYQGEGSAGETGTCEVAQDGEGRGRDSIVLTPEAGWFVAHWVRTAEHQVNVDISTPPVRIGSTWSFEDLELDPYLLRDGPFGVDDEDEFDRACRAGLIPSAQGSPTPDDATLRKASG